MDLHLNLNLAAGYNSNTQKARVETESWVEDNLYCPICGASHLIHYPANKPVADFYCEECKNDFELKSKANVNGILGNIINDGAYDTMISRISDFRNPNFFFMTHDDAEVSNFILIPNYFFTPNIIIKRKPLSPGARRAGWTGCNIDLNLIPDSGKIFIIQNKIEIDHNKVIGNYNKTTALNTSNIDKRGWIMDVLVCVDKIPSKTFSLKQVYEYIDVLKNLHPANNNIEAKIRQQLQYLRDLGVIEFYGRGEYHKL
jgi:type II restriction enzyme